MAKQMWGRAAYAGFLRLGKGFSAVVGLGEVDGKLMCHGVTLCADGTDNAPVGQLYGVGLVHMQGVAAVGERYLAKEIPGFSAVGAIVSKNMAFHPHGVRISFLT